MKIFKFWYCRKSTESDEKQIQSIDSQISWIRWVLNEEFEKIQIFTESKSAKDPGRREWFKNLIWEIEKINKNYKWEKEIIIYAWWLDRLSRNPVDSWLLQYFLQIWKLHKIVCCDKIFTRQDSWIMMWLFNALNNQYILDLQKNTLRWMKDKFKSWDCVQFTPNWYINNKLTKKAEVDEKLKPIIQEIFKLRADWYSLRWIVSYCKEKGYKTKNLTDFSKTVIERILRNSFYIWFQTFQWKIEKANHETFIDIDLWNRVNNVVKKGVTRKNIELFPLKGIIKSWNTKKNLIWQQKKGKYIYYSTHNSVKEIDKISINQDVIIKFFDWIIHLYQINEDLRPIVSEIINKEFQKKFKKVEEERISINRYLAEAQKKSSRMFNLVCNWTISEEKYKEESNILSIEIEKYKKNLEEIWNIDTEILDEANLYVELLTNLSIKRKTWNKEKKLNFIKIISVELFVTEKKELILQENKLFEFIKIFNMDYLGFNGAQGGTRTRTRWSTGF